MRRVVRELEYAVLYDDGYYWIIEDKIFRNLPFKRQAQTKTALEMIFDFVELPGGGEAIARVYIPKEAVEVEKVLADLERWNKQWLKKKAEVEALLSLLQGQQSQQQEGEVEEDTGDWESVLKKYF